MEIKNAAGEPKKAKNPKKHTPFTRYKGVVGISRKNPTLLPVTPRKSMDAVKTKSGDRDAMRLKYKLIAARIWRYLRGDFLYRHRGRAPWHNSVTRHAAN